MLITDPSFSEESANQTKRHFRYSSTRLSTQHGEDCIGTLLLQDAYPLIVIADGASLIQKNPDSDPKHGLGGAAASIAVEATKKYLGDHICEIRSLDGILAALKLAFDFVQHSLSEDKIEGATTLQVILLWYSPLTPESAYWCYAYEGDGYLMLLNPHRKIDGVLIREELLSPQIVEHTATISQHGCSVRPVIGCRLWEAGDLVYTATDGLAPAFKWCEENRRATLDHLIVESPISIAEILSAGPYYDDASLGVIWMESGNAGL